MRSGFNRSNLSSALVVGMAFGSPGLAVAQLPSSAEPSRAPVIGGVVPPPSADGSWVARAGRRFELAVDATDPDGDPLSFSAAGLPRTAHMDPKTGLLVWTPSAAEVGTRLLKLTVSDGQLSDTETVRIDVVRNDAPSVGRARVDFYVGIAGVVPLDASDPDGDPLTCTSPNLPDGASLDPNCASINWLPQRAHVGSRSVTIVANDGVNEVSSTVWLDVSVDPSTEEEWESYFLPGVGYSLYAPRARDELGVLQGPLLELVLVSWIHRNENRGPSHGRVVAYMERFESTAAESPVTLGYGAGFTLSLERNPQRRWLVPFYGVDLGGLRQDDAVARFHWTPQAGVHVWSSQNLFVNARAGYRLVPGSLERWSGWYTNVSADVTVW